MQAKVQHISYAQDALDCVTHSITTIQNTSGLHAKFQQDPLLDGQDWADRKEEIKNHTT